MSKLMEVIMVVMGMVTAPAPEPCPASWYGHELAGERTASGAIFDPREFTGASMELPLGSWVTVSANGRSVDILINDVGPAPGLGRCVDLSQAAFDYLGDLDSGTMDVVLDNPRAVR